VRIEARNESKTKNTEVKTKSLLPTLPKTTVLSYEVELLETVSYVTSKKKMGNIRY
jgi:hypothetical protein